MKSGPIFQVLAFNRDVAELQTRTYKRRRVSTKTKHGCLACKAKRVKCDESHPICLRCQRNGRSCSYSPETNKTSSKISRRPGQNYHPKDQDIISSSSSITLASDFYSAGPKNGTSTTHLIQHFHVHWMEIFHVPLCQEIISASKSSPLVENTILAITACHLRHVSPGVIQYRIAEHFQQSRALRDFQTALDTPRERLGQSGVDYLMLSAMLLNMISFALPEQETTTQTEPCTSWVFGARHDRLDWLALQVGLRPLSLSVIPYIAKTLDYLGPIFLGKDDTWSFRKMDHGLDGISSRWIQFFELDGTGSGCDPLNNNTSEIFRGPVTILVQLRELEPVAANIFKNIQFLAKVQQDFRRLLYLRDGRALWLFGYWLGVMCRYSAAWWCEKRSRRDYSAICVWLQQRSLAKLSGEEGKLWTEMMDELRNAPIWNP